MNNSFSWSMVGATVLLTVYGQIAIKWQVVKAGALPAAPEAKVLFILRLLLNPWILSALAAAFLASLCWMAAMSKLPLNRAYPFMALNFILVTVFAAMLLDESITWPKVAGLALIVSGLVIGSLR